MSPKSAAKSATSTKTFDRKFGPGFLSSLPTSPGVYRVFDEGGALIYVGKAKNLRRRLSQYRNAKRRKRHAKMREIVAEASKIELELCPTDLDACLLEERLIRELRPRWNVAGAFSFLYPMIGLREDAASGDLFFVYTTTPAIFQGLEFHGAYRSREIAGEGFFALMRLLRYVGHSYSPKQACAALLGGRGAVKPKHSYVFAFRRLPEGALALWRRFLRGESVGALEELSLGLLENAGARKAAHDVQADLRALKRFWRAEAQRLARAIHRTAHLNYPVAQEERDSLFLRYKYSFRQAASNERHPE